MTDLAEAKRALLAEWEHRRGELDTLIAALRRELGLNGSESMRAEIAPPGIPFVPGTLNVSELVRPGDFFGMTQVDAMEAFLQRTTKQPATLQELAQAMFRGKATDALIAEAAKLRNLSSLLSKTGTFFPVARGRWGLAEWYPNKTRVKRGVKEAQDEMKDDHK